MLKIFTISIQHSKDLKHTQGEFYYARKSSLLKRINSMKKRIYLIIVVCFIGLSNVFAQQGVLKGKITDKATGEELVGAAIVVDQTTLGTITDFNGEYKMPALDAGTYTIRVQYVSYTAQVINDVEIKPGQETVLNIQLASATTDIQEVSVTAKANRESENMLLLDQKKAVVATQAIGAQELSRKGVSDAEGAVTKVSGISKQEGIKNVFVRGLGDRYNITTLNGFPVPSDDPEYKNISLDFFTSDIIKAVDVNKVFNSQLPGDVAGADININSKELVGSSEFNVDLSANANTETVGKENFLIPDGVNGFGFAVNTESPTSEDSYSFKNSLDPSAQNFQLGKGIGISGGKRFDVGENDNPLSFFAVVNYSRDFDYKGGVTRETISDGTVYSDLETNEYETTNSHLGMLNLNYSGKSFQADYNFMAIHTSKNTLSDDYGKNTETFQNQYAVDETGLVRRQQINDNTLLVNQIRLNKEFSDKFSGNIGASYNYSDGKEPDRRVNTLSYTGDDVNAEGDTVRILIPNKGSGRQHRYFGDLIEKDYNVQLGVEYKLTNDADNISALSLGYAGRFLTDDYNSTSWDNTRYTQPDVEMKGNILSLDSIFNDEEYQLGNKFKNDNYNNTIYTVDKKISSYNANLIYQFGDDFVLNLGAKADKVYVNIDYAVNIDGEIEDDDLESSTIDEWYFLPSVNLKYSLNDKNDLRLGGSKTYTLPQSKEISPMLYEGRQWDTQGNTNLIPATNYNVDLKWDYYLSPGQLISVTAFAKIIKDPISRVEINSAGGFLSYDNIADHATVGGVEVEMRKKLFSTNKAEGANHNVNLGVNFSYLSTEVKVDSVSSSFDLDFTNSKTKLEGASPILVNADISYRYKQNATEWNSSLVLNYFSDRIYSVGVHDFNDVIENSRSTLDFVTSLNFKKHWGIKFKAKNLTNPEYKLTREASSSDAKSVVLRSYKKGANLSFGLSYKF